MAENNKKCRTKEPKTNRVDNMHEVGHFTRENKILLRPYAFHSTVIEEKIPQIYFKINF